MFTTPGPNLSYEALSCLESGWQVVLRTLLAERPGA
jgi:hypothetical protein